MHGRLCNASRQRPRPVSHLYIRGTARRYATNPFTAPKTRITYSLCLQTKPRRTFSKKKNESCGTFVKFRLPRSRDNEAMIHATWSRNRRVPQIGPILLFSIPDMDLGGPRDRSSLKNGTSRETNAGGSGRPFCPNNRHCRHSRCFARDWNCGNLPPLDACRGFFRQITSAQIVSKSRF